LMIDSMASESTALEPVRKKAVNFKVSSSRETIKAINAALRRGCVVSIVEFSEGAIRSCHIVWQKVLVVRDSVFLNSIS